MDAAARQNRQQRVELFVADEGLTADDRQMQRTMLVDEREDTVDQLLPFEIADLPQRQLTAQMIVAVGVAAGTSQRTLTRDLNRQRRGVTREDPTPSRDDAFHPMYLSSDD
jgi:hypothetical protein